MGAGEVRVLEKCIDLYPCTSDRWVGTDTLPAMPAPFGHTRYRSCAAMTSPINGSMIGKSQLATSLKPGGANSGLARPLRKFLHRVQLNLLNFRQPFPLFQKQMVKLFMQHSDFQFGLQIDAIIVL